MPRIKGSTELQYTCIVLCSRNFHISLSPWGHSAVTQMSEAIVFLAHNWFQRMERMSVVATTYQPVTVLSQEYNWSREHPQIKNMVSCQIWQIGFKRSNLEDQTNIANVYLLKIKTCWFQQDVLPGKTYTAFKPKLKANPYMKMYAFCRKWDFYQNNFKLLKFQNREIFLKMGNTVSSVGLC